MVPCVGLRPALGEGAGHRRFQGRRGRQLRQQKPQVPGGGVELGSLQEEQEDGGWARGADAQPAQDSQTGKEVGILVYKQSQVLKDFLNTTVLRIRAISVT